MKKTDIKEDKVQEIAESYAHGDKDKSMSLLAQYLKGQEQSQMEYNKGNPVDAPNSVLNHAIVTEVTINSADILSEGDFIEFFKIGNENFYCWTFEKNMYSHLVVRVNPKVKDEELWKTSLSVLEIAFTMSTELEYKFVFDYDWIYRFKSTVGKDNQHYLKDRHFIDSDGPIRTINEFRVIAPLIELLYKDNKFFTACQNIIVAKENHEFCQVCALTPEHLRKHPNHEPEPWEKISIIPKMESAVVLATRSIEAILGKPGKRDNANKTERIKQRWLLNTNLNPDDEFLLVGKSYFDYYYDLFELRNHSAHSLGEISFKMLRRETIEAQCFAWIVIAEYYKKNKIDEEYALEALNFNIELIKKFENINVITQSTKKIIRTLTTKHSCDKNNPT